MDNGLNGHVCIYEPLTEKVLLARTPTKVGRLGCRLIHQEQDEAAKDYDWLAMTRLVTRALELSDGALVGLLEEPLSQMTGRGSSNYSRLDLFRGYGLWQAAFASNGIEPLVVHPSTWKSSMGLRGTPKEYVLVKARELRPDEEWKTVDAADAFLMAYYLAHRVPSYSFLRASDEQ